MGTAASLQTDWTNKLQLLHAGYTQDGGRRSCTHNASVEMDLPSAQQAAEGPLPTAPFPLTRRAC